MTSPDLDRLSRSTGLDVILGSTAAVLVALIGLFAALAKKSRRARCRMFCLSL